jgi:signal transduction histidine kinase
MPSAASNGKWWSFRAGSMWVPVALLLLSGVVFAWTTNRVVAAAIRKHVLATVGVAANGRSRALVLRLESQRARAEQVVKEARRECAVQANPTPCEQSLLTMFVAAEEADAAGISLDGAAPTIVGRSDPHLLETPFATGAYATFEPGISPKRTYVVVARVGSDVAMIRYSTQRFVDPIFLDREGLGESGETFLTNEQGLFVTPHRYASHSGESHPISARPMVQCLAGRDAEVVDLDYRSQNVVHGFRRISAMGGCIMAHVDYAEAMAPARRLLVQMAVATTLLVAVAIAWALGVRQSFSRAAAALRDSISVRDKFLSAASHELRTPLTALSLRLEKLQRDFGRSGGDDDKRVTLAINKCAVQLKRLERLINELLDVTRIRTGRLELHLGEVNLVSIVEHAVDLLESELDAARCKVVMRKDGAVVGCWDEVRLEQVVVNLVQNATKFGRGRPIELAVSSEEGRAMLLVRDHGVGIGGDELSRIFEPFERSESAKNIGGLGLGLFIVRGIVQAHGGTVRAERNAGGEGATFVVELPLAASGTGASRAQGEARTHKDTPERVGDERRASSRARRSSASMHRRLRTFAR